MGGVVKSFSMSKRLQDKVAIITGGSSGIGASTAAVFLHHGAKVIIADIKDELGQSLCRSLNSEHISYVHCNVTDDSEVESLVNHAMSRYGKLDIMFNNAGTGDNVTSLLTTQNEDFKRVLDINLYGAFLGAKHAAKVMIPRKKGVILFTASVAAVTSGLCPHSYTASKAGVVGLARSLGVELGEHGIRVNCVSPCAIATPLLLKNLGGMENKKVVEKAIESTLVLKGVVPKEEDIAETIVFLASDEAKLITGHNLMVDGGYSTTNLAYIKELIDQHII